MLQGLLTFCTYTGTLGIFVIGTGALESGQQLGQLAPSAILGVIVVTCFGMLKKLYNDKNKTDVKLQDVIVNQTKTMTENTEVLREQCKALIQVQKNSEMCMKLSMEKREQQANAINQPITFGSK